VNVNVITSAKPAELQFQASSITKSTTLNIAGASGTTTLSFTSGATASSIAFAINRVSDTTGVSAKLINSANPASGIAFTSTGYGSANFVSISALSGGSFATEDSSGAQVARAEGVDAVATINGALTVGQGATLHVDNASLDLSLTLGKNFGTGQTSFDITGGGALFQLGSTVESNQQVDIGIQSIAASSLGDEQTGYLSDLSTGGSATVTGGQAETAEQIVELAITQVSNLRGKLGAFEENTLSTNVNSLNSALENVTSSESTISDANFAEETANLTRAQILVQAGTSVLATANSTPKDVLSLLQGS
jgi:flagellin